MVRSTVHGFAVIGVVALLVLSFENCAKPNNISPLDTASADSSSCWTLSGTNLTEMCGTKVGIGTTNPTTALEVNGIVTGANVNQAPIFSTYPSARATVIDRTWQYTGESLTITVPTGPTRKYRISFRQMGFSNLAGTYITTLSTSNTTIAGTPQGLGMPYEPIVSNLWTTINSEGYVNLWPGTYTYYVMAYHDTGGAFQVANATADNGAYCVLIAWPL